MIIYVISLTILDILSPFFWGSDLEQVFLSIFNGKTLGAFDDVKSVQWVQLQLTVNVMY